MRVLLAPDCFGGTLTAVQAAEAMRAGWLDEVPGDEVTTCPLADGGPGFLEVLHATLGGELLAVTVSSPTGARVPGAVLVVDEGGRRTAYLEPATAAGHPAGWDGPRDPGVTTTRGVGELLVAAREAGAQRVVVGLGGSATNDGGAGMLAALGVGAPDGPLARGGAALAGLRAEDLTGLREARAAWAGLELVAATDVDVPLLGLTGASAGFAQQKGATPEQAQHLERALGDLAHAAGSVLADVLGRELPLAGGHAHPGGAPEGSADRSHTGDPHAGHAHAHADDPHAGHAHPVAIPALDALTDTPARRVGRLVTAPGAGAAGGLGFGLALLGARLVPGSRLVADAVGLAGRIAAADVVVTGEGRFDWQSLHGKVVAAVADAAAGSAVPVVVLAGQAEVGRREWSAAGIAGVYAVAERPDEVDTALADPAGTLRARVRRVARTWSR